MRFDEEWIIQPQLDRLADLAASTAGLPGEVIEIGTWQGRSAIPLANAIYPDTLHVVDHWLGDDRIRSPLTDRDNYGIFLKNVQEGTRGNVEVHKCSWQDLEWDLPVRFLHLDAAHSRPEVSGPIGKLLPFAVPGAVFAGDDWPLPGVRAGVTEHFPEVAVEYFMWRVTL